MTAMLKLIKRLKYAFAVVLVTSILIGLFHDSIFRWMALRAVQQIPGLEVVFNGRFDISHIFPLTLDAEDVEFVMNCEAQECSQSQFGKLHLELNSMFLLKNTIHIEKIKLTDGDFKHLPQARIFSTAAVGRIQVPFIKSLILERINIHLQPDRNTRAQELKISHLQAVASKNGDIKVHSLGRLNSDEFEFTADLGSIDQFFHPTDPFPIDISFQAPGRELRVDVSGTLAEPLNGLGAKLKLQATSQSPEMTRYLTRDTLPTAQTIQFQTDVLGGINDYYAKNFKAEISGSGNMSVVVGGTLQLSTGF